MCSNHLYKQSLIFSHIRLFFIIAFCMCYSLVVTASGDRSDAMSGQASHASNLIIGQDLKTYTVKAEDTLWRIAQQFRPETNVSIEQMMIAILHLNPQAFIHSNIHGIKHGHVLNLPDRSSIQKINPEQASAEVEQQTVTWYGLVNDELGDSVASKSSKSGYGYASDAMSFSRMDSGSSSYNAHRIQAQRAQQAEEKASNLEAKQAAELKRRIAETRNSLASEQLHNKSIKQRIIALEDQVASVVDEMPSTSSNLSVSDHAMDDLETFSYSMGSSSHYIIESEKKPITKKHADDTIKKTFAGMLNPALASDTEYEQPADRNNQNNYDSYFVLLEADPIIKTPGLPGSLSVWIGNKTHKPEISSEKVSDESTIAAVGGWAVIQPMSVAFDFDPEKTDCIKIDASGSEKHFKVTPKNDDIEGEFEIRASVDLYNTDACTGSPVPKGSDVLKVTVEVDIGGKIADKKGELLDILWEQLLKFWEAILVVFFGLLLFLFKNKIKALFGYSAD